MTALEYLKGLRFLPNSVEHGKIGRPSNSELKRWLNKKSVIINGKCPCSTDEVIFPIRELVFFPKGKRKTTMVKDD